MKNKLDILRKKRVIANFAKNSKYWKHSKPLKRPYQTMDFACRKCGYIEQNAFVQAFLGKRVQCSNCTRLRELRAKEKSAKLLAKRELELKQEKQEKQKEIAIRKKASKPISKKEIQVDRASFTLDRSKATKLLNLDMTKVKWSSAPKNSSSHGEAWTRLFLDMLGLRYKQQVTFDTLRSPKGWKLRYDFVVENKLIIEYDGIQHRHFQHFLFSNQAEFDYRIKCDSIKNSFAKANNIPLVRLKQETPSALKNKLVKCLLSYTKDC